MPIKKIVLVKRKQGLSPEEFRAGYENSHSRLAVELFGHLWTSYRRNYLLTGYSFGAGHGRGNTGGADEIGFDAISEFTLADEGALEEMSRISMQNFDRIKDDEGKWFDQVNSWLVTCETIEEDLPKP
jgi:hypothetical protein